MQVYLNELCHCPSFVFAGSDLQSSVETVTRQLKLSFKGFFLKKFWPIKIFLCLTHSVLRFDLIYKISYFSLHLRWKLPVLNLFLTFKCTEPSQSSNLAPFVHASLQMKPALVRWFSIRSAASSAGSFCRLIWASRELPVSQPTASRPSAGTCKSKWQ